MKTSQQIRLENFDRLLSEAGSQAALSQRCNLTAPYVSQLKKRVPLETGAPRSIGDEAARKLEHGMGKPKGWMDADHSGAPSFNELNAHEAQMVTLFRKLTDDDRDEILQHINKVFNQRFPTPSAAHPFAAAGAPGQNDKKKTREKETTR